MEKQSHWESGVVLPKPPEDCGRLIWHTEWFSISLLTAQPALFVKGWLTASTALPWKLANNLCYFNEHKELAQCLAAGSLDLPFSTDLLPTLSQSSLWLPFLCQKVKIPSLLPPTTSLSRLLPDPICPRARCKLVVCVYVWHVWIYVLGWEMLGYGWTEGESSVSDY